MAIEPTSVITVEHDGDAVRVLYMGKEMDCVVIDSMPSGCFSITIPAQGGRTPKPKKEPTKAQLHQLSLKRNILGHKQSRWG